MDNKSISDLKIAEFYNSRLPTAVMLTMFSVIGIPGNLLVVLVNLKAKKMTNTNFIIFIMAIVDFVGALSAFLNVIKVTLWFEILDIKFCKLITTLNYVCNTPAIFLIFGVSVIRYYSVCKPHMIHLIHTKVKPFCVCVLLLTIYVGVVYAICASELPWEDEDIPGFYCGTNTKGRCALPINIALAFVVLTYLICLNGLIGLNFRILKRMYQQRKIMSRYKHVRKYKHSNAKLKKYGKKTSKPDSITDKTESLLTSNDDINDPLDDIFSEKDINIHNYISKKMKSIKSEDTDSFDISVSLQEKTDNCIEHQTHPRGKG